MAMDTPDFTKRDKFPGNSGNNFDILLSFTDWLGGLPAPVFALILLLIAVLARGWMG